MREASTVAIGGRFDGVDPALPPVDDAIDAWDGLAGVEGESRKIDGCTVWTGGMVDTLSFRYWLSTMSGLFKAQDRSATFPDGRLGVTKGLFVLRCDRKRRCTDGDR